ncbi:MAG: insulinase family protein [Spirochaetota bacterium]|nr:MAG: insulinase family protein [Spirochaetota bacterium]
MKRNYQQIKFSILVLLLFGLPLFLYSCASPPVRQELAEIEVDKKALQPRSLELDAELPIDPQITIGTLKNGLTYYIRENINPENRAELRLVVNAGSVLEDEDQLGLAHFIEHMAFEGTAHFEKQEIVDYLESIGMRFGPDLNAYTTFDETVYRLQVPTDNPEVLEKAMQILEDWAHNISFEQEEIDKERGVIVEEWRIRRDAETRIRELQYPVLFHDSRYSLRNPIGKMDIIRTFDPDSLKRFYRDWYRPDLMAVIVVGDFDKNVVEKHIHNYFSKIPPPKNPRTHPEFSVPDHTETLFSITTDKELTTSRVSIFIKQPVKKYHTVKDYRTILLDNLFYSMLDARLWELTKTQDPPFIDAYSGTGRFVRSKEFSILGAQVKDNEVEKGLEALLVEIERIKRFGFTESEMVRQKEEILAWVEQLYNERDKRDSERFMFEYTDNYLEGEPIPGIEFEYELFKNYMPGITLDEMNDFAIDTYTEKNRVILISAPEKKDTRLPHQDALSALINTVKTIEISPYIDVISETPLLASLPSPSRILEEKYIEEIGVTEWTLENGVKIVLKPTDFKNDEILFRAFSPGGHSLVSDNDWAAAVTATDIIEEGGIGDFTLTELTKKLSGRLIEVSPWINELFEGMSGSATPEDLETMFQLIYLYFMSPRYDETSFLTVKTRMEESVKNREASPEESFWDTVRVVLEQNHYRAQPWTEETISRMDAEKSYGFYKDRFADAGDFTFFFVGNYDIDSIRPLVEQYLGGLPSSGRIESWRDLGIDPPDGIVREKVKKGIEQKSMVQIVYNGETEWTLEDAFMLSVMEDVLDIPLRESIREEEGGAYSVWVFSDLQHFPDEEYYIYIGFGCDPDRAAELTSVLFDEIEKLKAAGPKEINVQKVKEILKRERETSLLTNDFWLGALQSYYIHSLDPVRIMEYDEFVEALNADTLKAAMNRYFNNDRYVQVVLYPENWEEE